MTTSSLFRKINIIGWEDIEPLILSCLIAKLPLCLIGRHGTNKTEGCEVIAKSLLGENSTFQLYDVSLLQVDDLMGFPNPNSIKEGKIDFVSTPLSIFGKNAVCFDEANRGAVTTGKCMEILRTRKVMGIVLKTLEYVFITINPPQEYGAEFFNDALASRLFYVRVPELECKQLKELLTLKKTDIKKAQNNFKKIIRDAELSLINFDPKIELKIIDPLLSLVGSVRNSGVIYSARQVKGFLSLAKSFICLKNQGINFSKPDTAILTDLFLGTVPEVQGVTARQVSETDIFNLAIINLKEINFKQNLTKKSKFELFENPINTMEWVLQIKEEIEKLKKEDLLIAWNILHEKEFLEKIFIKSLFISRFSEIALENIKPEERFDYDLLLKIVKDCAHKLEKDI